ncbi:nucleolar protein [Cryptococcus deuterogattii LA55]|nr:nucleolar protein [Cryptococcus deuterogattii LA55]KIR70572.1 nucleolar protein [Cryptococcus deuterogattii CA1014]KIR90219.1 nucleolar protein [Cryptococcus deuterogattii CBS 10090]
MEGIELGIQDLDRSYQIDTQAPLLDNDKDHKEEPDQPTKRKRTKEEKERRRSEKRAKKEKRRSEAAQAAQAHAQSQSQSQVEVEAEVAEEPTDYDEVEQAVEDAPVNEGSKKRKEQKQKKDKSKGKGKEKEVGEEQEEEYREAIAASAVATLAQALVSSESDKIASPVDQVQTPSRPTTAASSSATSRTVPIQYSSMKSKKGLLESSIAPPASSLMPGPPPTQLIPVTPLTAASASASSTAVINSLKHSKFSNSVPKAMRNTRKGEDTKESDAQLRLRFRDPKAQEAWLASTSIGKTELLRLEREVLSYKKGKFTEDEKLSIKKALENYQKIHRMSSFDLVELVMTKTLQATDKETVREFWKDIAASVPGRPILNVQPFVRRMLDPKAHKGRWTPEEDELLLRAYAQHPREWTKISSIVDRTEVDCRDRYLKELVNRDTRTAGRWTKEEEDKLEEVVDRVVKGLRAEQAIGEERENSGEERAELVEPSDVPWDIVSKEMGNTRSMTQCRIKYRDAIWPRKLGLGKDDHVGRTLKVLTRLRNLNYESEKHISWSQVRETLEKYSLKEIRNSYTNLKKSVTSDPHVASLMYPG